MKVFCKNCKRLKRRGVNGEKLCMYNKLFGWGYPQDTVNKDYDCDSYSRKWWKLWVSK